MKLEEKIAILRKKNGWSQEELAFRLDVSRQAVSKWEMGASLPDLDNVLKMSEIFGCSTDYLLKENTEEKNGQTTDAPLSVVPTSAQQRPRKSVWKYVEDLFWLLIVCAYLLCSFWTGAWYITWIVFPIAGVLFAIFESVLKIVQAAKVERKDKKQ